MAKKPQKPARIAAHTVVLGQARRERIRRFCAQQELSGNERPTIPDAVNLLIDKALELELVAE